MRILTLFAAAAVAFSGLHTTDAAAKPWTVERFKQCATVKKGDAFAESEKIETTGCTSQSVVRGVASAPNMLSADASFVANRPTAGREWSNVMVLMGTFERLRGNLVQDPRSGSRVRSMKIKIGEKMFVMSPDHSDSTFIRCNTAKVLGSYTSSCSYAFVAFFQFPAQMMDEVQKSWTADPAAALKFRAFFDEGEEFDGEILAAEPMATAEMATAAWGIQATIPDSTDR